MAETRRKLGRGLDALLSSTRLEQLEAPSVDLPASHEISSSAPPGEGVYTVPLQSVHRNPHQPRQLWNQEKLFELAESIKVHGVVQPIVVRPMGDGYQLIAGERRLRACEMAGLQNVPAIVRDATEEQMLEWALVENIHRADLNPLERARAYQNYMQRFTLSQQQAAERLGEDRSTIANYVRLLDLSKEIQDMVNQGLLSMGHARALLGAPDVLIRQRLAERAAQEKWSVRELERQVQALDKPKPAVQEVSGKSLHFLEMEQELKQALGTKVSIKASGRKGQKGKIIIEYYSLDEFDRIRERLQS